MGSIAVYLSLPRCPPACVLDQVRVAVFVVDDVMSPRGEVVEREIDLVSGHVCQLVEATHNDLLFPGDKPDELWVRRDNEA